MRRAEWTMHRGGRVRWILRGYFTDRLTCELRYRWGHPEIRRKSDVLWAARKKGKKRGSLLLTNSVYNVYNYIYEYCIWLGVLSYSQPSVPLRFHNHGFNQSQVENIQKKENSRKFQKAKLEFATHPTIIYIAFTLYLQWFTWYLHCIRYYN